MATNSVERPHVGRVLCFAPRWLGDAVLARPALAWLGASGFETEVLARHSVARVFEDLPGVRALHTIRPGRAAMLWSALGLRRRYSSALVLSPSFSSALAASLTLAPVRAGHATDARAALLHPAVRLPQRDVHLALQDIELAVALAGALGAAHAPVPAVPEMPALAAHASERLAARRLLAEQGIADAPYFLVAPGARYGPAKRYPAERFAAAARILEERFASRVVLVGDAGDAAVTAAVRGALPSAVDLAGRTPLGTLVGLLSEARGVLANDSGTMHLAAALGRPVAGVFGASNPRWTAPLGPRAVAVCEPVWCAPCYAPTCVQDFGCMLGIAPQRLVDALAERLEVPASGHAREPRV